MKFKKLITTAVLDGDLEGVSLSVIGDTKIFLAKNKSILNLLKNKVVDSDGLLLFGNTKNNIFMPIDPVHLKVAHSFATNGDNTKLILITNEKGETNYDGVLTLLNRYYNDYSNVEVMIDKDIRYHFTQEQQFIDGIEVDNIIYFMDTFCDFIENKEEVSEEEEEEQEEPPVSSGERDFSKLIDKNKKYYITLKNNQSIIKIYSKYNFVLKAGSHLGQQEVWGRYKYVDELREELIAEGKLVNNELLIDLEFDSLNRLATFVTTNSVNAWITIKDEYGNTIDSIARGN